MRRDTPTYDTHLPMGWDTPAYDVNPDPVYGFVDFVGELFSWGLAGGSALHFTRGFRGAPRGARLAGAVNAVLQNAPGVAGKFGAYCILCSAIENAVSRAIGRDDAWTAAAAVAATCGIHGMRRSGAPAAAWYTLLGGTGYLGMDYAIRVWEIKRAKEMNRKMNRVEEPVLIVPRRAGGPTDK